MGSYFWSSKPSNMGYCYTYPLITPKPYINPKPETVNPTDETPSTSGSWPRDYASNSNGNARDLSERI